MYIKPIKKQSTFVFFIFCYLDEKKIIEVTIIAVRR